MLPDLGGHNVAFIFSSKGDLSEEEIFEKIGALEIEELILIDGEPLKSGVPKHLVRAAEWDMWLDQDNEDIRLIDWGEAFARGSEPATLAQQLGLAAPETIFTSRVDYRIDLWCAGYIVSVYTLQWEV